jgi:ATP-dependent Clp protease ATP-binding subunit ClpA
LTETINTDDPVRRKRKVVVQPEEPAGTGELLSLLERRVVGQRPAMNKIVPYIQMCQAGLAPEGRPIGVFLLLGPTGTGKTLTVETLAEVLHGNSKNIVKIDCGEFQLEHEVAKLVGAPPGYLGHRETTPMLTQAKLSSVTSEHSNIAIVLFDEIEKAAPSMSRLLLGILDKATVRLGDNNTVNFQNTLIFLTSNLGAHGMLKMLSTPFGFSSPAPEPEPTGGRLEKIALAAVRRQFSPEFLNRIDVSITYQPLDKDSLRIILDHQLRELQTHIIRRLGQRAFKLNLSQRTKNFLLKQGTSVEYGAREIKRTIHRQLTQPISALVADGLIEPGSILDVEVSPKGDRLTLSSPVAA